MLYNYLPYLNFNFIMIDNGKYYEYNLKYIAIKENEVIEK